VINFWDRPGEVRHFVHKRFGRAIGGFLTGGPTGAISGFLSPGRRTLPGRVPPRFKPPGRRQISRRRAPPRRVVPSPGIRGAIQRFVPGGSTGLMVAGGKPGDGCPQGFHPNKSDYMTKAGFVPAHSKCVRNRRRNLSNGRANTRSLRRMAAWDKQERKLGATLKKIARGR